MLYDTARSIPLLRMAWAQAYASSAGTGRSPAALAKSPMAVAPIGAVRRVVEFALTQMEPGKILLGFPNYAYDWTLPFTAGATRAQSIGNEAAPLLAAQYGAEIQFDEQAQTPYFTYLDEAGQPHEVWFEDARSALAKFGLLTEYGLLGLGYWNFMRPFAAGFSLQNYLFSIP